MPGFAEQSRALIRLAWPIAVSLLSYSVMTVVDTFFVGRIGPNAIAAVGLGGIWSFTLLTFGLGALRAVKVRAAYAVGAGREDRVAIEARAGVSLAALYAAGTLALAALSLPLLPLVAGDSVGSLARTYVLVRGLSMPMVLLAAAIREASQAAGDSRSPMRAALAGNVLNIPLNALLVLGLGFGVAGSAFANVVAQAIECGWLLWQRRAWLGKSIVVQREDRAALFRLGWPQGLEFILDVSSFSALAVIVARIGANHLAAHQIVLQVSHLTLLPLIAVGEAACVLVGQALGAGKAREVTRTALIGCYTGWLLAFFAALGLWFGRHALGPIFTTDREVLRITAELLAIAGLNQLFFVPYIIGKSTLRGAGDVRFTAISTVLVAWACTPTLGALLGIWLGWGAAGAWWGLIVELCFASALFTWRLASGRWLAARDPGLMPHAVGAK
jgi:multidrug resistance protein, MATE family